MDNRVVTGLIIIAAIAITVLFFADSEGITAKITSENTVKIGGVLPLTGVSNSYGQFNREGIDLALEQVNSAGGINGKPLEVIYEDSQSRQNTAVTALQKIIEMNNVPMVLVGASSPETLAQAPIAEEKQTVLLALGSAAEKIRYSGDYIFRLKVSVDEEIRTLMQFVRENLKAQSIYILYVENDYGESVREFSEKNFIEMNGTIKGQEGFIIDELDYRTYLIKLKNANPDVIVLAGWPRNLGQIMKQAKELGINANFVAPGGAISPEIIEIAKNSSNGLIYTTEFDLDSKRITVQDFRMKYKIKYNKEPELFSAMGYDAIYILADILKICKDSDCIKKKLYQVSEFEGVSGIITFDKYGDVSKPLIFMEIRNETFIKYKG